MAHYTLQSGQRSQTITSRCPICLKVAYHTDYTDLTDISVCCSSKCYRIYHERLWELWKRAQIWGIEHCGDVDEQSAEAERATFNAYMIEVGH